MVLIKGGTMMTRVFNVNGMEYTEVEIKKLIKRYLTIKNTQKLLDKELSDISSTLTSIAQTEEDKKVILKEHSISISDCTRVSVSYSELEKKHPKIAKEMGKVSAYTKLNVK